MDSGAEAPGEGAAGVVVGHYDTDVGCARCGTYLYTIGQGDRFPSDEERTCSDCLKLEETPQENFIQRLPRLEAR